MKEPKPQKTAVRLTEDMMCVSGINPIHSTVEPNSFPKERSAQFDVDLISVRHIIQMAVDYLQLLFILQAMKISPFFCQGCIFLRQLPAWQHSIQDNRDLSNVVCRAIPLGRPLQPY